MRQSEKKSAEVLSSQKDEMVDRVSLHMPTYLMRWQGASRYCGCVCSIVGGQQQKCTSRL